MSKEQQGLLDEVYENYKTVHKHAIRTEGNRNKLAMESLEKQLIYTQKDFINKINLNKSHCLLFTKIILKRLLINRFLLQIPSFNYKQGYRFLHSK
jgi:hypothetical protein